MSRSPAADRVVRQRLTALTRALPGAVRGDVDAIHQARVATRRVREVLPLAGRAHAHWMKKTVRRLTRALGPVRELDVARLTLDETAREAGETGGGVAALRQALAEERAARHARLTRAVARADLDRLQRRMIAGAGRRVAASGSAAADRDARVAEAVGRAARRADAVDAAMARAGAMYLPDRLHEVRIAVKKLRYAVEIVTELRRSRATARLALLKRVQDCLGQMHDLDVLIVRIRALQGSTRAPDLQGAAELDRLVRHLELECRQLHARYIGVTKSLRDLCHHLRSDHERLRAPAA